jgi:hypothetical protein
MKQQFIKIIRHPFLKVGMLTTLAGLIILIFYLSVANIMAIRKEKKIEQDLEAFASQFPPADFNDTANQIRQLTPKLGFGLWGLSSEAKTQFSDEQLNIEIAERDRQAWEKISESLKDYLNQQFSTLDDAIIPPPKELQDYLSQHAETIEAIRDIVLNQPSPVWWSDITPILEGDYSFALPSYLNIINLQKILALDILEKQRQGNTEAAIAMLEVSWKLTEDLQDNPYLIGQLVNLISKRYLSGTIRKLDRLPEPWQQRLVEHDYQETVLTSLEGEFFGQFNGMRNQFGLEPYQLFETVELFSQDSATTNEESPESKNTWFWQLLTPAIKSYFRLAAVDLYEVEMPLLEKFRSQDHNICQSDRINIDEQLAAWWNPLGQIAAPSFLSQVTKAQKYMLDLELTQKILQVKEEAAKTEKWPETVDNLESDICPGFTWVYQVAEDGTMSLSLSQEPDWQADRLENNRGLPLTYRDRTISQSKPSAN